MSPSVLRPSSRVALLAVRRALVAAGSAPSRLLAGSGFAWLHLPARSSRSERPPAWATSQLRVSERLVVACAHHPSRARATPSHAPRSRSGEEIAPTLEAVAQSVFAIL